jgi:signal peptidase I
MRHNPAVRRWWVWAIVALVVLAAIVFGLRWTYLLYPVGPGGESDSPTIPPCHARTLAEGFTYHFRDPKRGELVVFHARGHLGGLITPDTESRDLGIVKRVVGVPGDTVSVRHLKSVFGVPGETLRLGYVYVNGVRFDQIETPFFPKVTLGKDQYYVLGDNRTYAHDSRDFGPVPRDSIFAKVFLIYWPLSHFGGIPSRKAGPPPGHIPC